MTVEPIPVIMNPTAGGGRLLRMTSRGTGIERNRDGAENFTNRRPQRKQNSYHNNSDQNQDQGILYQTLTILTTSQNHVFLPHFMGQVTTKLPILSHILL